MPKQKPYQLVKRGKRGNYSLRVFIEGEEYWRSTKTPNLREANKRAEAIVETLKSTEVVSRREASVHKVTTELAEAAVKKATGKTAKKIPLDSAHTAWEELQDDYLDLQQATRDYHVTMFDRFTEWVEEENPGIKNIDEVTPELAKTYANYLTGTKVTAKTFNEHIQHLSSVFATLDSIHFLPYRNPFDKKIVKRKKKTEEAVEGHVPVDPDDINDIVAQAAEYGEDYRDLFIIGANTGLRLKDACLLKWGDVEKDFIDVKLYKTARTGNRARIPISSTLHKILNKRKHGRKADYVLPDVAKNYNYCPSTVRKKTKKVFEDFYGKNKTQATKGSHRKIKSSILSFHSFRVTYMSLLASKDVSIRMAMRIMGWLSPEMIRVYEKELEKAKGESDNRSLEIINSIDDLEMKTIPEVVKPLVPTKEALEVLVEQYSNITLGKIYGITEAAIRQHLKKHGIVREKRIESADVNDVDIRKIQEKLKDAQEK